MSKRYSEKYVNGLRESNRWHIESFTDEQDNHIKTKREVERLKTRCIRLENWIKQALFNNESHRMGFDA